MVKIRNILVSFLLIALLTWIACTKKEEKKITKSKENKISAPSIDSAQSSVPTTIETKLSHMSGSEQNSSHVSGVLQSPPAQISGGSSSRHISGN